MSGFLADGVCISRMPSQKTLIVCKKFNLPKMYCANMQVRRAGSYITRPRSAGSASQELTITERHNRACPSKKSNHLFADTLYNFRELDNGRAVRFVTNAQPAPDKP